jgi:benzoyl-CoA reductase/2-hydroxyglutaryl-CoA dehydratase subunit BcrC/BadD/HgdB
VSSTIKVGNYSDDYSFLNRYRFPVPPTLTGNTMVDAKKNWQTRLATNIARLRKVANRPDGMRYFDLIMADQHTRVTELQKFKADGGKIIGMFCVQVPEELIYAAGCVPIRLECGFSDSIPVGETIIPTNTCCAVKSTAGFQFLRINPFFELCDALVIPTTCDAKKKMADVMSNYMTVWTLELPNNRDHLEARDLWLSQVEILRKRLEKLTGKRIQRANLENATKQLQKRTRLVRDLLDIRRQQQLVINGRDVLLAIQSMFNDDLERWMRYLEALNHELIERAAKGIAVAPPETPRIMVTGSPIVWPAWKVLDAIEENGGIVVIDDSCAGSQAYYNPVEVADWSNRSLMTAISDKYLLPTICPVFIHNDDRIDRILELSSLYKVHGIVYHVLRLCQVMDFEFNKAQNVIKQKKLPLLKVETDYGEQDLGQIKTRVEAFIEMIHARSEQ